MSILHTIECTAPIQSQPGWRETFTEHLIRRRRLTEAGCERILNRERENKLRVASVQYAIFVKR